MFKQLLAGEARWPLFLYGSPGTGKSCAALALCDIVPGSYYLTAEDAAEAVLHGTRIVWDVIQERRLVVLDEIGCRENVGDLHYQALKRVADLRDHMATVYVSNLAPGSIATKYDERIASRLLCGSVYELAGDDRRME